MRRCKHREQLVLEDFCLPLKKVSGDNRWTNHVELIPWNELEDGYRIAMD